MSPLAFADALTALAGGAMIGAAAGLLLVGSGRVAGISGICGGALSGRHLGANLAFIAGLAGGPLAVAALMGAPAITQAASPLLLAVAGLAVGIGTRMGAGCTSGHGVIGLARFSQRSAAAVAAFLASGIATVALLRLVAP